MRRKQLPIRQHRGVDYAEQGRVAGANQILVFGGRNVHDAIPYANIPRDVCILERPVHRQVRAHAQLAAMVVQHLRILRLKLHVEGWRSQRFNSDPACHNDASLAVSGNRIDDDGVAEHADGCFDLIEIDARLSNSCLTFVHRELS